MLNKAKPKRKHFSLFVASAIGTVLFGVGIGSHAAERRLTASTSCHGVKVPDQRFRGFDEPGTLFTLQTGQGTAAFVCDIPSDSLIPHNKIKRIHVHGENLSRDPTPFRIRACATDFRSGSYTCGRFIIQSKRTDEDTKFQLSIIDLHKIRAEPGWFPALYGDGMDSGRVISGYWIQGDTNL